jgi:hypothetical protein
MHSLSRRLALKKNNMTKILNPRVETIAGETVCLCGEPSCGEVLATITHGDAGQGPSVVLPSLITEVGEIKGVKRYARDMAQEFGDLDSNSHLSFGLTDLPIVVVCPATHQENLISPDVFITAQ